MTLEQAIEVLISRYNSGVIRSRTNDDEWRLATETAIAALRPTSDPETGLVPCGCGGAADVADDLASGGHFVCCSGCGTMTGFWSTRDIARDAWNRAMGLSEDQTEGM